VLDERDKVYGQIAEYLKLKTTIEQIQVSLHCRFVSASGSAAQMKHSTSLCLKDQVTDDNRRQFDVRSLVTQLMINEVS